MEETKVGKGVAAMGESKGKIVGVKRSAIYTVEEPCGAHTQFLKTDCGDHYKLTPFKGPIVKRDGFVIGTGVVPDELKFKPALRFKCPNVVLRYPKKLPIDPTERKKVISEVHKQGLLEFVTNFKEAHKRAKTSWLSKRSEEAPPTTSKPPTTNNLEIGAEKGKKQEKENNGAEVIRKGIVEYVRKLISVQEELEKARKKIIDGARCKNNKWKRWPNMMIERSPAQMRAKAQCEVGPDAQEDIR